MNKSRGSYARYRELTSYRSITNIQVEILELLTNSPLNKTAIKYQASLSSRQIKSYITNMVKKGYIQFNESNELYNITEYGLKMLEFDKVMKERFSKLPSLKG